MLKKLLILIAALPLLFANVCYGLAAASAPTKIQIPFANAAGGAYVRTVPNASQIGIQNGAASYTDGFPPLNFTPINAGGVPPFGQDMNGVLRDISAHARWWAAGGPVYYDGTYQTAIGGYPLGSIVQSTVTTGLLWVSTADNNVTNPDTGGAGWQGIVANKAYADAGGTADAITASYSGVPATLVDGYALEVHVITPNVTATPSFTPTLNGVAQTTRTVVKKLAGATVAVVAGDLQGICQLRYDSVNLQWILVNPTHTETSGSFIISLVPDTGTITPTTNYNAYWTIVGDRVFVNGYVNVGSVATPSGGLRFTGFPRIVANGSACAVTAYGLAATATTSIVAYMEQATTNMIVHKYSAGALANLAGDVQANSSFIFSCNYKF